MDLSNISPKRRAVLDKIAEKETAGLFHDCVEDDPPSKELLPEDVDYL